MKKESIASVLKNGTTEKGKCEITVKNGNFTCTFIKTESTDTFLNRQKKTDRRMKNEIEFGHPSGFAYYKRENQTQKILAKLQTSKRDCRRYYAMYMMAMDAPGNIQKIVYENIIEHCKNADANFVNHPCPFYVAEILPAAWISGWEKENIVFDFKKEIKSLTPKKEIGTNTTVMINGKKKRAEIIGYSYLREKVSRRRNWYGSISEYRHGKYVLFYKCQYGENRFEYVEKKAG